MHLTSTRIVPCFGISFLSNLMLMVFSVVILMWYLTLMTLTLVPRSEKQSWELVSQNHDLRDAWPLLHSDNAFTYHSQAHTKSWARLDRMYLSGLNWCPPVISISVEYQWHLSYHFPLLMDLQEYSWKT